MSHLAYRILKLLNLVETAYLWKLLDRPPISNWVHESGKVVVIGDACHPVLVRISSLYVDFP